MTTYSSRVWEHYHQIHKQLLDYINIEFNELERISGTSLIKNMVTTDGMVFKTNLNTIGCMYTGKKGSISPAGMDTAVLVDREYKTLEHRVRTSVDQLKFIIKQG